MGIAGRERRIGEHNAAWRRWFTANGAEPLHVTASFGVALYPDAGSGDELLSLAQLTVGRCGSYASLVMNGNRSVDTSAV